jgi:hypothetical protein
VAWSLPRKPQRELSQIGSLTVGHEPAQLAEQLLKKFLEKNAVAEYAKTKGFKSTVSVSAGWYMENHIDEALAPVLGGFPFQADEDGYYTLRVPRWGGNEEMPFISLGDDYGDIVHGVFLQPEKYNGQLIQGISQSATATQLVEEFEKGEPSCDIEA